MRRLLAAGACALALAGCAPADPPAEAPAASDATPETSADSPTTEPSTPAVAGPAVPTGADAVAADDLFVAGLRAGAVEFADPETMVILGRGICAELQQGAPVIAEVDAVTTGSGGKWDQGAAGAIVGSAIGAYCPEFRALLPN
ncbi:DUF732 domain-containing protein [Rhodococcoides corynebacterioides]|uniref:DUF732 domain-containing protein n=1 Tax=Rhodococcoides corynebacterioides TaxID=53972 RepID=UPI003F7DAB50